MRLRGRLLQLRRLLLLVLRVLQVWMALLASVRQLLVIQEPMAIQVTMPLLQAERVVMEMTEGLMLRLARPAKQVATLPAVSSVRPAQMELMESLEPMVRLVVSAESEVPVKSAA